jgi:hypothetical protein
MYKLYYCPNCRATIYCGDMFCGNCGVRLKWIETQTLSANPAVLHHKPGEGQRYGYRQQQDHCYHQRQQEMPGQYKHTHQTQRPEHVNPQKHQNGYTDNNRVTVHEKKSQSDDTTEPLKVGVAKLFERFLEKMG